MMTRSQNDGLRGRPAPSRRHRTARRRRGVGSGRPAGSARPSLLDRQRAGHRRDRVDRADERVRARPSSGRVDVGRLVRRRDDRVVDRRSSSPSVFRISTLWLPPRRPGCRSRCANCLAGRRRRAPACRTRSPARRARGSWRPGGSDAGGAGVPPPAVPDQQSGTGVALGSGLKLGSRQPLNVRTLPSAPMTGSFERRVALRRTPACSGRG